MVFINEKEIEKELKHLDGYLTTRRLSLGERSMLLANYMSWEQRQLQKEMMEKMKIEQETKGKDKEIEEEKKI